MGVPTNLNFRHPFVLGALGLVLIIALISIVSGFGGSQPPPQTSLAFFTTDDTSPAAALVALFTDSSDRLAPLTRMAKPPFVPMSLRMTAVKRGGWAMSRDIHLRHSNNCRCAVTMPSARPLACRWGIVDLK